MRRNQRGQSMVEYALGIGCVTAVCMLALQGLGMTSADIMRTVIKSTNDTDDQAFAVDPTPIVNKGSTPWAPQ